MHICINNKINFFLMRRVLLKIKLKKPIDFSNHL